MIILLISLLFLNRRRWKAELESKEAALAEIAASYGENGLEDINEVSSSTAETGAFF